MKRYAALFAMIVFATQMAAAQTYGLDNTNPAVFSSFRIPKTDLSALWFTSGINYSSNNFLVSETGGPNSGRFNSNLGLNVSPYYYRLEESDNRYLSLNASASGAIQDQYNEYDGTYFGTPHNTSLSNNSVNISISGTYRDYASSGDYFYSAGTNDQFGLNATYQKSSSGFLTTPYAGALTQKYNFTFGIGVGKMRNVTAVVSAIRFQQRLKQLNLLNGDLSESTIEDLAQQFYREAYYGNVHVRPDKFFWQDVQDALAKDGVSLAGLNQYADSYLREVPNELRFSRNEGAVAGLNLQVQYANSFASYSGGYHNLVEALYTMANAYAQYSHQLDLKSQFSFSVNLAAGPNVVRDSPVKQQYIAGASVGYNYELTDRLVLSASNNFNVSFQNMGTQGKNLQNSVDASVNYFLEDRVSLYASYSLDYSDVRNPPLSPVRTKTIDNFVNIGVTYYIDRGFIYK